ncbi:hypothetical protein ACFX1S_023442 [Malus domestica]|uniref:BAR domain-containing protein n=1 Tax=Malus domestica TaxID=3750 RepID=A0A498HG31_MALDO|nr:hypothetical protein DVH24_037454 [Malus domestica]
MKTSLGMFRRFELHKNDAKEKRDIQPLAQVDELAQAAQDMQDMRSCYDSLLSAAAATANSAYEFSESLREMGTCLLEKTALHDDEESGRVFLMLGRLQYELQKLVDRYRSHIFLTITNPSESLLNELRTVEEMKRQCDEKREVYDYMVAQQKEKGRSKRGKGDSFTLQQLQVAHDEYDEEATLCVFRLKSLKQGQARSLLTQAARHHAAQLNFFRKGLKSLEAVEPHVRLVTEEHHIEYQFSGLEDDGGDDGGDDVEDNGENSYDPTEDGELSFNYRSSKQGIDVTSASRNSMEVDEVGPLSPKATRLEHADMNLDRNQWDMRAPSREPRIGSHSAPIFPGKKFDPAEKARQLQASTPRKSNTYVLPTPIDPKGLSSSRTSSAVPETRPGRRNPNLWHSSPLEEKDPGDDNLPRPNFSKTPLVQKESNVSSTSTQLPPPLEGRVLPQLDTLNTSDTNKTKRDAFSGPIPSKSSSSKPLLYDSGPIASTEPPQLVSGMLSRLPNPQPSSPKVSPCPSPPLVSSPKISELHELPRPPGNSSAAKPTKSSGFVGHSAPLVFRNQEHSMPNKNPSVASNAASPLPAPPLIVPRSFSIPSGSQRAMAVHVARHLESPQVPGKAEEVDSPPLTPISLSKLKLVSNVSEVASHSSPIREMEITRSFLLHSSCSELPLRTPFHHSQVAASSFSIPITSRTHIRKPLATSCSASDGGDSSSAVKVSSMFMDSPNKAMDITPELKGTSIFLVGMKSSMKTSLGKLLANALRYYYFDSDSLVEEAAGGESAAKSLRVADINGFRESETEVLKQLSSMGRLVVCAGDGAVQSSTNLALLRYGISVWIDVPVDLVASGMVEDQSQLPALNLSASASYQEVLTHLSTSYEEARGGYETADATVSVEELAYQLGYDDLGDVTTENMALEVLKEIEKLTRVKKMMEAAARPF